ncbi:coproporphyrinogen III oxidase and related Fe-S oxidoreductases [Thiohalobacter thiocyanaticus]|uniref:Heme chaperone HemW n=1 Tax=Thiohalobacter thiocyanaticus TaxID=585455 RepID=A0A1Z4VLY6_9GAMM|nr:radical SAM family heme chaperone HemW [Thiohalobacter thiocyanaticus]BAZ92462.1 coproporphyrinogen III oxidase and related Fe-S oxidoreductases [Thiohalobacter thiocyanaticus]
MFNFTAPPPLALYVHIPWCVRKCPYCDFNSHELRDELPERDYIAALIRDLDQDLPMVWGRTVESIFIGGGTPSLFSAEAIARLLSELRGRLPLKPDLEVTLEANPGTVEQQRFADFRSAGINRLSIGIQSFDDDQLQKLGRIHGRREAIRAAEAAHAAGFDNFNLDLMFGLPDQRPDQALADLNTALDLEPSHLSWYQLTLEPNTWFYSHPPRLPDDDTLGDIQEAGRGRLASRGYTQYEVSAFARSGHLCRHNLNYWRFGDYLGIGAGAHGKLTLAAEQRILRRWKCKHPRDYLAHAGTAAGIGGSQTLGAADARFEFLLNALRLQEGFTPELYTARTGLAFADLAPALDPLIERGLLELDTHIRATPTGYRFLNDVLADMLPDDAL